MKGDRVPASRLAVAAAISRLACEALAPWEANPTLRLGWKTLETSRAEKRPPISPLRNDVRDHGTMQWVVVRRTWEKQQDE